MSLWSYLSKGLGFKAVQVLGGLPKCSEDHKNKHRQQRKYLTQNIHGYTVLAVAWLLHACVCLCACMLLSPRSGPKTICCL